MSERIQISVVLPVYNEQENVSLIYKELVKVIESLGVSFELVFVDDGSKDASYNEIELIKSSDSRVRGISLSRNFGHQIAIAAGMDHAEGEVVIMMDSDMQHPPALIPEMYKLYKEGYDIVNTRRKDAPGTSALKKGTSGLYYRMLNSISDVKIEHASADFRLMSRKVVESFREIKERDRFTRGLVSWMGFKQTIIGYEAAQRASGASKYTMRRMLRFGLDGVTSFSSRPLRLAFYVGLVIFLMGIGYAIYALVIFIIGKAAPGWTSILISVLVIGGFQLLSLGIIGEYIARIFNEAKRRPLYFVKDSTDIEKRF